MRITLKESCLTHLVDTGRELYVFATAFEMCREILAISLQKMYNPLTQIIASEKFIIVNNKYLLEIIDNDDADEDLSVGQEIPPTDIHCLLCEDEQMQKEEAEDSDA